MVHYVIKSIDVTDANRQTRDLLQLEQEVNSFVKDPKIQEVSVSPVYEVIGTTLYVGVMINYQMTPR